MVKQRLFLIFSVLIFTAKAEAGIFDGPRMDFTKPEMDISLGYGVPYPIYNDLGNATGVHLGFLGPLQAKFEYQVTGYTGIGGVVNYFTATYNWNNGTKYNYSLNIVTLSVLFRINYHFIRTQKTDVYLGAALGFRESNWYYNSDDPSQPPKTKPEGTPYGAELTIGMRYFFAPWFGLYAEAGAAKSVVQAGLVFKFLKRK
jgi:hypothetical protein